MKAWIVWNEAKNEGVVFTGEDGRQDALQTKHRSWRGIYSAVGREFAEGYDDDELTIQEVELPEVEAA